LDLSAEGTIFFLSRKARKVAQRFFYHSGREKNGDFFVEDRKNHKLSFAFDLFRVH
jgi:hypothetical protein